MIKTLFRNLDYTILTAAVLLLVIGTIMIHSASTGENLGNEGVWKKQIIWSFLALLVILAIAPIPYKFIYVFAWFFYGSGLIILILTQFYGSMEGGSERWLTVGTIRFQPSEFMKIATIIALARFLSEKKYRPTTYSKCIVPFIIIGVPMLLVWKQPDLGTALVFAAIIIPMLYWAGLETILVFFLFAPVLSVLLTAPLIPFTSSLVWVAFMLVILAVLYYSRYNFTGMGIILGTNIFAGIATPYLFDRLSTYQQERITTIFNPEADPLGKGYQILSSKITIGSGGIFGKGIGGGRYTELGFLPRAHTDFIFSVICEELGFLGAVLVIGMLFFIVYRGIMIATEVKNQFLSIAAIGISTVFAFHMFVNIGMAVGIMPVTGLPLPFLSYGGSSCLTNAIMIGLLLNFRINRHEI